jgi:Protein phosphatase 2C
MTIQRISLPGRGAHNEDLIAVHESEGLTDIIVIDGATSVADQDYINTGAGDVAWFVREFAAAIEGLIGASRTQERSVWLAVEQVRAAFEHKTRGLAVPLYASPIAALTWVRIWEEAGGITLETYCLGDCKSLLVTNGGALVDLDPYVNEFEFVVQQEVARLASEGVTDQVTRRERMLPLLRSRRESQHMKDRPTVLCLRPKGPFDARQRTFQAGAGSTVLAMTDGFYRLVDMYEVYTAEELAGRCVERGLETMMQELRDIEAAGATSLAVKSADDASVVMWSSDGGRYRQAAT